MIASIDGRKYESEFKVEYYIKPEYEVKVNTDKTVVIGGERIKSDISALYYFGDPVKGARCRYSIYKTRYQDEAWHKDQEKSFYITESEYVYSQMELIKTGELNLDDNGSNGLPLMGFTAKTMLPRSQHCKMQQYTTIQMISSQQPFGIMTTHWA